MTTGNLQLIGHLQQRPSLLSRGIDRSRGRLYKAMATALGMPIRNRGQQYPRYDGQWVNLSGLYLRFVAHEIGHWVAASEWELELVDYGLLSMETDTNMQREAVADTVARKVTRAVDAVEYEGVPTVWDTPQWEFIRTVHRPNT